MRTHRRSVLEDFESGDKTCHQFAIKKLRTDLVPHQEAQEREVAGAKHSWPRSISNEGPPALIKHYTLRAGFNL